MNFSLDFFSLQGKVAMITGGNTGIGREIALALAAAGADIFIYAHSNRDMDSLIEEVAKFGKEARFQQEIYLRKKMLCQLYLNV